MTPYRTRSPTLVDDAVPAATTPATGPRHTVFGTAEFDTTVFDTIVIGADGSPASHTVVDTAGRLAVAAGTEAVHVVTGYRPLGELELARLASDLPDEFRTGLWSDQRGETIVADACTRLRALGIEATGHPVPGKGADAVLDIAAQVGADLIVVGTHRHGRHGRLDRLVHGSTGSAISRHAECSVLVVRVDRHATS
jgi:nucleotide-binding universal stress UspA family protein